MLLPSWTMTFAGPIERPFLLAVCCSWSRASGDPFLRRFREAVEENDVARLVVLVGHGLAVDGPVDGLGRLVLDPLVGREALQLLLFAERLRGFATANHEWREVRSGIFQETQTSTRTAVQAEVEG